MLDAFENFEARIDREELRVARPSQLVFLCGGLIDSVDDNKKSCSLRDYIIRLKKGARRINAKIVLAETAQQLYRDTNYDDLISFEEDIAHLSSLVLVISESPGSLAELGAFASEEGIRESLRVIISEEHSSAESFVRYGPVRRIENIDRERVGVFPWRTNSKNGIIKASIDRHFTEMVRWINEHIDAIPETHYYRTIPESQIFYDIVWSLSIMEAAPPEPLYEAVRKIHPGLIDSKIKDYLYVLKTCRWVGQFSYSGRDYYYLPENRDPFEYAFQAGERPRDIPAFKVVIAREFHRDARVSRAVMRRLQEIRGEAQ